MSSPRLLPLLILLVLTGLPAAAQVSEPPSCIEVLRERIERITRADGSVHIDYAATIENRARWTTGNITLAPLAPAGTVVETMTFLPGSDPTRLREVSTGIDVPATGAADTVRLLIIMHNIDWTECCTIEHEIRLAPRPPNVPIAIRADRDGVKLRFEATPSLQCCVQRSPDLAPDSWETFVVIDGAGQEVELAVAESSATGETFYRLLFVE